jgi:small-conductance mechanosensitive channel
VRHLLLIALLLALTGPALAKVKKIFKTIGNDMYADPLYAQDFMQPFQSHGVYEVDDVGIVIRGKFMARPGRQFVLRKEIYDRVQRAFEQHGIQFARREIRVRIDAYQNSTPRPPEPQPPTRSRPKPRLPERATTGREDRKHSRRHASSSTTVCF